MSVKLDCIPTDIWHVILSHSSLEDALELSKTSRAYRSLVFSVLNITSVDMEPIRSLFQRCQILGLPLLKQINALPKNDFSHFFSLSVYQVKALKNFSSLQTKLSENSATPNLLLEAADRALSCNNVDLFISIAQNPSLMTFLSTSPQLSCVLHHSQLMDIIIRYYNLEAMQRFIELPGFAQIPDFENIEMPDGSIQSFNFLNNDHHFTDLLIQALDVERGPELESRKPFLNVLLTCPKFFNLPSFALGTILSAVLEDGRFDFVCYVCNHICPRITKQEFLQAFAGYFSGESNERKKKILCIK